MEYSTDLGSDFDAAKHIGGILLNGKKSIDFSAEVFENFSFGERYCYFSHGDCIIFMAPMRCIDFSDGAKEIFLACKESDWRNANKSDRWKLREMSVDGHVFVGLRMRRDALKASFPFKFISSDGEWLSPDDDCPNCQISSLGTANFLYNPNLTGGNVLQYHLYGKISLCDELVVEFCGTPPVRANFSRWIASLRSDARLGATASENSTIFRVFAPRAANVRVAIFSKKEKCPAYYSLAPAPCGIWHAEVCKDLRSHYYYYQFLFGKSDNWATAATVLDPYAKAATSSAGPGIILPQKNFTKLRDKFATPNSKDLVILEMHLRDVLQRAPRSMSPGKRLNFCDLEKYLKKRDCYLRTLGVNCVELQPIQEFDYVKKGEYHWGYMPANWFSPASAYAKRPENATQVSEFKKLVRAFHRAGIAVILDVVYNHFGDSGHLKNIDDEYYFRHSEGGNFTNFSGCGNDFRTESYMARKLVIDSLEHLIKTYNVDGFRFDLAELLGIDFLNVLQKRLKNVKKSVVLVTEPWSFRGNIGVSMKRSQYSVWNDEYRDFVRNYVLGNGNSDAIRYFLCGGLDFRSGFPGQSVNYVASHDDRGWVDSITENSHNDGGAPTENDRRRTRLSAAILMMSIGVPMLTAGQDFLASKRGVSNTYNRGDLNALDYDLLRKHRTTHEYFRRLIAFRLSKSGEVLRLENVPDRTYFRFFSSQANSACALMYNANGALGRNKFIFAVNPHLDEATVNFRNFDLRRCRVLANGDKFFTFSRKFYDRFANGTLVLPPLSCRIYAAKGVGFDLDMD
ncbi:MAG: hypothetical protein LBI61_03210 [Puniceicoccales bacterium]|nr:hypothetical protein [Puniceicoccales bacterium]